MKKQKRYIHVLLIQSLRRFEGRNTKSEQAPFTCATDSEIMKIGDSSMFRSVSANVFCFFVFVLFCFVFSFRKIISPNTQSGSL